MVQVLSSTILGHETSHRIGGNRKRSYYNHRIDGSKIARNSVFDGHICRQSADKWQLKTLFLTIFDLHSSIVLTFSIAAISI